MSEMVERVARAMCEHDCPHLADAYGYYADQYRARVRAALEALREPTPEMVEAGRSAIAPGWTDPANEIVPAWSAMITAALGETGR